ncbi:hypothetical protein GCM10010981_12540 [Dyella nitratireducens]|uniref:Methyltransferase domain-containing protein n=1 Tax=Dyella nitratireducens TaxID=1849580 RepID=A0ABQ1FQR2_9GAMM|nr:hypothetical protein GCM10010981_12540 [Dyella nitratireducens]GLQ43683.1 hypothetical protein GCM10007902_35330 [Dyella nitratireducens]
MTSYRTISDVHYFECSGCGSLSADAQFLADVEAGKLSNYTDAYWQEELKAARERSFGSSLNRVAETFLYSRIPIDRYIDVGSGPGYLLDALSLVMPSSKSTFHAVELFPPAEEHRTTHPNYVVGTLDSLSIEFEAGSCIEVIEHLTPSILRELVRQLASRSTPGALYYFNSAQPEHVKQYDQGYLDPYGRGHIVSYSLKGLRPIFAEFGFTIHPLHGRTWAFLAEFDRVKECTADELLTRVWTALPQNIDRLKDHEFGPLMYTVGIESARCYLEHAIAMQRTNWALSLVNRLTA